MNPQTAPPDLGDLRCFLAVVEASSFSAAAATLGLPKTSVSRRVAALEQHLGVQLLERTTRSVRTTPAGAAYARQARQALLSLEEAGTALQGAVGEPRGRLSIGADAVYGEYVLAPALARFGLAHPAVGISLTLRSRAAPAGTGTHDLDFRAGPLGDGQSSIARVAVLRDALFASPAFLARRAAPRYAHELSEFPALCAPTNHTAWTLEDGAQTVRVPVRAVWVADHPAGLRAAAEQGLGIALIPECAAREAVAAGRLVRVLEAWRAPPVAVHALVPDAALVPSAVRALLDHLADGAQAQDLGD